MLARVSNVKLIYSREGVSLSAIPCFVAARNAYASEEPHDVYSDRGWGR